ncbi:MAG: class I SAM-dependent methyltransferase, partial [Nitrospirota bacterium]
MFDYSHVMILFMSKTVICPICFCPNSSKNLVKLSVTILYRCDLCGVVFCSPNFHNRRGDFFDVYPVDQWIKYYAPFRLRTHQRFIRNHSKIFSSVKSVMDIGCAAGWFLDVVKKNKILTVGIDPSPSMKGMVSKKHKFYSLAADQVNCVRGVFNMVTFWNVFEHFGDPHKILNKVSKKLTKSGLLILSVPNQNGFISRISYLLAKISKGKLVFPLEELFQTNNAFGHLFHYNRRSLTVLLKKHKFAPLLWEGSDIVDTANVRQRFTIADNHFDEIKQQVLAIVIGWMTKLA